ncbi:NAD(P)H-binding protein [Kribbella qitaiheensis]|uniref:NAD(P)H-binding protein n=1 Tax=Kribbella qitaiheensis TaxID=1544730 RepID=A0A7G6X1Y6_9ACTN|nr:NAD(P)H-binding protein [Kribbella qitaiheensis]QNE20251.1 NAD(P)H-binding protein [Kribbella qitaiheensis]
MILISGGRGAVATQLTALLAAHGLDLRVGSTEPGKLELPQGIPSIKLDLTDPATFPDALSGISSVFLYAESAHITEFVDAAVAAGVQHIVVLSSAAVLSPDAERDHLAKSHLDVEHAVRDSSISTTILRPGSFAGNASAWAWPIKSGRPVSLPFPGSYNDPIHEKDIAEVAFAVLTEPRFQQQEYTLSGPESLTFAEQLEQLAAATDQTITINRVTPDEWKKEMAEYIPELYADSLLDWWKSNDGKPVALTSTVEELTGHPARTFADWAQDHATEFKH